MDPLDDPFAAIDAALDGCRLAETVDAVVVDIHRLLAGGSVLPAEQDSEDPDGIGDVQRAIRGNVPPAERRTGGWFHGRRAVEHVGVEVESFLGEDEPGHEVHGGDRAILSVSGHAAAGGAERGVVRAAPVTSEALRVRRDLDVADEQADGLKSFAVVDIESPGELQISVVDLLVRKLVDCRRQGRGRRRLLPYRRVHVGAALEVHPVEAGLHGQVRQATELGGVEIGGGQVRCTTLVVHAAGPVLAFLVPGLGHP